MNTLRIAITVAAIFLATACTNKNPPEPVTQQPTGIIPQAQLDALNKAKNVEGTLMQADQQRREQIDQ